MGGLAFWVSPYTPYKAPPPPHCPNASVLSVSAERCLFLGCQSSPSEQRLLSTFPIFTSIFLQLCGGRRAKQIIQRFF
ncbi:hypothetical protein PHYPO_G00176670 [Pangasianodon hypophthalmus]|uniref:Uncharacterized protein n=1 Tax=Pangasianodon hypophthalmus TaxID=310915 RepID=A0A5N5PPJ2_PANHP|nr:hypothetical protein PHYPO_G00176670 [Pangasianodon hypophthalmus]